MIILTKYNKFAQNITKAVGIIVKKGNLASALAALPEDVRAFCSDVAETEKFDGATDSLLAVPIVKNNIRSVFIAGLGEKPKLDDIRSACYKIARTAASNGIEYIHICNAPSGAAESRAAAEGAALAAYRFKKYVTKDSKDKFVEPKEILLEGADAAAANEGRIMGEWQCFTRALANEPANVINPVTLAEKAKEAADKLSLECEIWNEDRILAENMGAYYAVAKGSNNPPRFIRLSYIPVGECKGHIAIVGKGLTFDSGGLDIKPSEYMLTMKGDKSGACAVIGAICAAAEMKLPWKVTAIVAAAENMPGGNSYRPDDILRARNGKTIEVNNTDAEGRLTLADAIAYASELKPDYLLDIATLTGACAVALGSTTAGLFTNNDAFGDKLLAASAASGERFWKLPMDDPNLRKAVKSPYADLVNSAGRYGGAITAAMFLEAFVGKDIPWVHLDIAAADFVKEPYTYYSEGASGFGMRTIAELIREL